MTKNTDFETVGAMHQCKKGEMFSTCAHCGAMAGKLNSPCPQYMRNAAAAMTKAAPVAPAPQPVVPEGYVLVPVEPTQEMEAAAYRNSSTYGGGPGADYRAMIAAAPKAAPAELPDAVAHYGGVFTDEQLGMKPAPLQPDWCELRRLHALAVADADADRILAEWRAYKPAPLQQGEYLPLAVASAPDRIWLDLGFDPKETDADFSDLNTPTWSADNASGHGIEYVRADRAARGAAQAADAEPDMRSVALAAGAYTTAYSMLSHAEVHNADVDGSTKRLVAAINGLRSALGPSAPVAEDAANWHWLASYLVGPRTDLDDEIVASESVNDLRKLVSAACARAQAAQPEGGADANR